MNTILGTIQIIVYTFSFRLNVKMNRYNINVLLFLSSYMKFRYILIYILVLRFKIYFKLSTLL